MFINLLIYFFLIVQLAAAQTRQEFWSRVAISKKISDRWTVGGDVQYRTQENYHISNNKRFENDLLQSIRITTFYKLFSKHQTNLIFSPIVYFRSFDVNRQGKINDQREYRWAAGIMQQYKLLKKVTLRNRLQYEMRFLRVDSPNTTLQQRPRWQLQATIPLLNLNSLVFSYLLFDEIFAAYQENNLFFEQNRIYNALQLKYSFLELNIGFQKSGQRVREEWVNRDQWHFSINVVL